VLQVAITAVLAAVDARATFTTFESGHVRPLALSPDGTRLFAVNTPDDRLEIFDVGASGAEVRDPDSPVRHHGGASRAVSVAGTLAYP
jgi:hypothetical protein